MKALRNDTHDRPEAGEPTMAETDRLIMNLSHGRPDPEQDLKGVWGTNGPWIIVSEIQWTYGRVMFIDFPQQKKTGPDKDIRIFFDDMVDTALARAQQGGWSTPSNDLIFYDGTYYGDFSIIQYRNTNQDRKPEYFDVDKLQKYYDFTKEAKE